MSLIIRGMNMPKNCADCFLEDAYDGYNCRIAQKSANWGLGERPSWCPLVEVPTPHGRLIDADALIDDVRRNSESYFADDFAHEWVDKAPTIIPASGR